MPPQEQDSSDPMKGIFAATVELPTQRRDRYRDAFSNFLGAYRHYYAEYAPVCFTAIAPSGPEAYGVHMEFASNLPGFLHVEAAMEQEDFRILPGNALFIPLDGDCDAPQDKSFRVRPVFSSPREECVYAIRINCWTRKAFAANGGRRNKDIIKVFCNPGIGFGASKPQNWKTYKPSAADVEFARRQWGTLIPHDASDYDKAKILTKALIRELHGHGGLPSAFLYGLGAFEKYRAIRSGKSKHACAQYSEIFSMACNCFGVVNRWGFLNDNLQSDEVLIELGCSHLVTEIFDRKLNQWIFIDGRANTLGSWLGDVGPLTLHEFLLFINQPARADRVSVLYYDLDRDLEQLMPVNRCPKDFLSYRGWTKGYHTGYRNNSDEQLS